MTFTAELLSKAKTAQGIGSDYKLSQLLGVNRGTVSAWRTGSTFPGVELAWRLAELAGTDPAQALLGCAVDRSSLPGEREKWASIGARLRAAAADETGHSAPVDNL